MAGARPAGSRHDSRQQSLHRTRARVCAQGRGRRFSRDPLRLLASPCGREPSLDGYRQGPGHRGGRAPHRSRTPLGRPGRLRARRLRTARGTFAGRPAQHPIHLGHDRLPQGLHADSPLLVAHGDNVPVHGRVPGEAHPRQPVLLLSRSAAVHHDGTFHRSHAVRVCAPLGKPLHGVGPRVRHRLQLPLRADLQATAAPARRRELARSSPASSASRARAMPTSSDGSTRRPGSGSA